jgi:hypothetical protein
MLNQETGNHHGRDKGVNSDTKGRRALESVPREMCGPHCGDQKDTEKFSVAIPFITHIHNDEVIGQ